MKKIVLNVFVAILGFSGASTAFAMTPPNMPPMPTLRDNLQARKEVRASTTEAIKAIRAESREEIKNRIELRNTELKELKVKFASSTKERRDQRQESLRKVAEQRVRKMIERIQATIDREISIANKILSRADKVKTNGGNTTDAEKYVSDAKTNFTQAQTMLDSLKNASSTVVTIIDPGTTATSTNEGLGKIRGVVQDIEAVIKEGHKNLEKAVKALGLANKPTATTTTQTN